MKNISFEWDIFYGRRFLNGTFFTAATVVIVFSNDRPNIKQLALDRWKIFIIQDNELIDFTTQYTKIKGETTISDEDVGYRTEYNY